MRRTNYKKYLILLGCLIFVFCLPTALSKPLRMKIAGLFSPLLRQVAKWPSSRQKNHLQIECKRLESENFLLRSEIVKLKAAVEQKNSLTLLNQEREFYVEQENQRRLLEIQNLLASLGLATPAHVIYREPANWTSFFWVDCGEETNEKLGKQVIQKNSPVILGRGIVGVVDEVGKKQSRIRLLTDHGLKPSVRALRGHPQALYLTQHIDAILRQLNTHLSGEDHSSLITSLTAIRERLKEKKQQWLLAKGIVHGGGTPLWRRGGATLRGVGFNYDFSDEEGPARDLSTGKVLEPGSSLPTMPLLSEGDLLVTTGMDGVFPAGLQVAEITRVFPLREGAYTFELEATPVVGNFDDLHTVFIIPPVGFSMKSS